MPFYSKIRGTVYCDEIVDRVWLHLTLGSESFDPIRNWESCTVIFYVSHSNLHRFIDELRDFSVDGQTATLKSCN
jgi:hypothetical protein